MRDFPIQSMIIINTIYLFIFLHIATLNYCSAILGIESTIYSFHISILENIWRLSSLRILTLYTIIAVSLISLTPNRKNLYYNESERGCCREIGNYIAVMVRCY